MLKKILRYLRCFYDAGASTVNHDGIEHAGYLAFLGLLSLFPFLVLLAATTGWLFTSLFPELGETAVTREVIEVLLRYLPDRVVIALEPRVEEIISGPPQGLLTIAILGAIWTASSAVEGMRTVLNRAYRVATPPAYPLRRLMSILQLLVVTAIITVIMLSFVFLPLLHTAVSGLANIPTLSTDLAFLGLGLPIGILVLVVASLYYFLPNIRQRFVFTLPGAFAVVVLWISTAFLFSLYLSKFEQVNLIYGSLGGIIAALLFFYFMGIIFIYGAELNYFLERAMGMRIEQKEEVPQPVEGLQLKK